jgi:glycosyltransferase involved in cell wall biosynthesis
MRLVTLTNLYPSQDQPRRGIFVEERLRQLVRTGELSAAVLGLRPGVAGFAGAGPVRTELRHSIPVEYVTVPTLPLLTNWVDPWLWARRAERFVRARLEPNAKDVVLDGHFLYPDGAAAVLIGIRLGLPTVLTARGSDVNVKCNNLVMRQWVKFAARNCSALITVSRALAARLTELRISAPVIEVLPNGVDFDRFRPVDRPTIRARLGVDGHVVASVGHLVPEKGHDIAIRALVELPGTTLLVVGEGPEKARLQSLADRLGVAARLRLLGHVAHEQMPEVYSAADALVLASVREGMPNVVLESLACGTRVVATDVGGVSEIVTSPALGLLMRERSPAALVESLKRLIAEPIDSESTRAMARRFGWATVVERQIALYRRVLATHASVQRTQGDH